MCVTNYVTVATADVTTYHIFMVRTCQRQMPRCCETPPPIWTLWRTCLNWHWDFSQQPSSQALLSWHVLWESSGRFHIRSELPDIYSNCCDTCELSAESLPWNVRVPQLWQVALQLWHLGRNEVGQLSLSLCIIQLHSYSLDSVIRNRGEKKKRKKCTKKEGKNRTIKCDGQISRIVVHSLHCFCGWMWLWHWLRGSVSWKDSIRQNEG